MDKARVNHAIGHRCSAAQAFEVFKIASMHLRASRNKRLGARIRASHAEHLMPGVDEFPNDGRTNKARCSCNKNLHKSLLCVKLSEYEIIGWTDLLPEQFRQSR